MDWRTDAECRDAPDPDLWFPVGVSGPAIMQITEAKAVCHRCPVASDCLDWALKSGQTSGVWGGMSEDERRSLMRRQAHVFTSPEPYDTGYRPPPRVRARDRKDGEVSAA